MKPATILIIDDERSIRRFLRVSLEAEGYAVEEAATGTDGAALAACLRPALAVLDLGLPDRSGFEVLETIREWSDMPVIILTVRDQEEDKVKALDMGADDYLTKPFGVPELLARIRAAFRRAGPGEPPGALFRNGPLEVDLAGHLARVDGQEVRLTATEFDILRVLVRHAGKVVTHRMLLKEVWGPNSVEHVQYLRVYLGHIRRKFKIAETTPDLILTEAGVGYRLVLLG